MANAQEILIVAFRFRDNALMKELERRVGEVFSNLRVTASLDPPLTLPPAAYDPHRQQYVTTPFLEVLEALPTSAARVLGVADVDLYAPGMLYVFGQARISGRAAVISLARLRPEFYGLPPNRSLLMDRASKEAVHELGHTFGLDHCRAQRCVMFFSRRLEDTDFKYDSFCRKCSTSMSGLIMKKVRT